MSDTCYKCGDEFVEGKVSASTGLCQKCSERADKPINDGGPAFPFGQISEATGQPINGFFFPGMTLRDWFAAHEIIDINESFSWELCETLAGKRPDGTTTDNPIAWRKWQADWMAKIRYMRADAMLKAREAK